LLRLLLFGSLVFRLLFVFGFQSEGEGFPNYQNALDKYVVVHHLLDKSIFPVAYFLEYEINI